METTSAPDRLRLSDRLEISRVLTGLWQVADIEKDGTFIDPGEGSDTLSYSSYNAPVFVDLELTIATALNSFTQFEVVEGSRFADRLLGSTRDESLIGNAGDDILVGRDGDDLLLGRGGRDLIVGGLGMDRLRGGSQDDVLIAGATVFDDDPSQLGVLLRQWRQGRNYSQRVRNVLAGTPGTDVALNEDSVFDDLAVDLLFGDADRDLFVVNVGDTVADQRRLEQVVTI